MQISVPNLVASTALGLCLLTTPAISFAQSSGAGPAKTGGNSSAGCSTETEGTTDSNPGTVANGLKQLRSAAAHLACAQRELAELATEMQQSNEATGRALATVRHVLSQLQPEGALGASTGSSSPPPTGSAQASPSPPSSPSAESAQTSPNAGASGQSRENVFVTEAKAAGQATSAVVKSLEENNAASAQPAEAGKGQTTAAGSSEAAPVPEETGPSAAAPQVPPPAHGTPTGGQMLSLSNQPVPPKPDSAATEGGEVRASRLIAQKLYSEKGGTFAQVEDILIDPKSARVTGVLVDKLGPSGNYTGKQLVVPLADIKVTAGNWLITDLGEAPLSK